jgi:putative transposase
MLPCREVVAIDPACTSQLCSGCGAPVQKGLSVRWHDCPVCGLSLHRHHNSAKTMHGRGQRLRGLAALPAGMNREPVGL